MAGLVQRNGRRLLSGAVSVVIVVGVFWYFLPQYANISAVWGYISSMSWQSDAAIAIATVWNLCTYWFVNTSTMPGLRVPQAAVVTEATTAVANTLPGGGALGIALSYAMYGAWGFSKSRVTVSLLVSGIWNNFAKLGAPVLAVVFLAFGQNPSSGRIIAGVIGVAALAASFVVFALLLRSDEWADRIGEALGAGVSKLILRPLHRQPAVGWGLAVRTFRRRTIGLVRARWPRITLATLVSHLSLFVLFLVCLRAVGVSSSQVSWAEAFAVFAFARLVTAIPITPGGVGIVEVALITGLSAAGGVRAQVAAAVLLFRALSFVVPIPLGLVMYLFWKRNTSWRRDPGTAPRPAGIQLDPVT
jgi:uncharacterized membrane protein YbhN (UPF0104 family)